MLVQFVTAVAFCRQFVTSDKVRNARASSAAGGPQGETFVRLGRMVLLDGEPVVVADVMFVEVVVPS